MKEDIETVQAEIEPPTEQGARHFRAEQTMLPCPFCGKAGEIVGQNYRPIGWRYSIVCETCSVYFDCRTDTEMGAALKWNERAAVAP